MPKFQAKPVRVNAYRVFEKAEQLRIEKEYVWAQPGDWVVLDDDKKPLSVMEDAAFRAQYAPAERDALEMYTRDRSK